MAGETVSLIETRYGDGIEWAPAVKGRGRAVSALLKGFESQVRGFVGGFGWFAMKTTAATLAAGFGGYYRPELRALAREAGSTPTRVLLANLAYDLSAGAAGCSTFAVDAGRGVLHARNLDWNFPRRLLQKNTVITKVRGAPKGDYALVTWPGFFGGLTAVAPGRFSVSVNFVLHERFSAVGGFLGRAVAGFWPVPWLVRKALDEAKDFEAAVKLLATAPVLAPVLFTVAGTQPGESVVLERTPTGVVPREGACVWVTNHYASKKLARSSVDVGAESEPRFDTLRQQLAAPPRDAAQAFELLSHPGLLMDDTVQQVAMNAREGTLSVRVPGEATTHITL